MAWCLDLFHVYDECFACMYVCTPWETWCPGRLEVDIRSTGIRIMDDRELPYVGGGNQD